MSPRVTPSVFTFPNRVNVSVIHQFYYNINKKLVDERVIIVLMEIEEEMFRYGPR